MTSDWRSNDRSTTRGLDEPEPRLDEGARDEFKDQAQQLGERARETATQAAERAQEQAESGRERAAEGVGQAASMIRERAQQADGMPAEVATKLAEGMEKAATYLREHDTKDIWSDIERYAKEHPAQAFAGAVFAGFLLGRILR